MSKNLDLFLDEHTINKKALKKFYPYRIPYMGSKQKIAKTLIEKMLEIKPNAKYFVDL